MRLILPIIVTLALFITSGCAVFAADSTISGNLLKGNSAEKRARLIANQTEIRDRMGDRMNELKAKIASKEAQLKLKLQNFKDQRKAGATQRISENLNKINANRTDQMTKHLDKMSGILVKLQDRVNTSTPSADQKAKIDAAISSASASIDLTKTSVLNQAAKDYTLTATSEAKIKDEAKAKRDLLMSDLEVARKQVIAAKQSVANAIRVAATTLGGIDK
jgi:hypothetical protein